jgi:hypothetical protein
VSKKKEITILNLQGDLSDSLNAYFEKTEISVLERGEIENFETLDYILISTPEEAKDACKDFDTDNNDIRIICIGNIKDVKSYLLSNGRLFINTEFASTELGGFVLNKFFFQNYNIHLDESFSSTFTDTKDFKITNHLASGLNIDQISLDAFDAGFNIVSLRSFIDHSIYYLTYLKQAGLAGIPYEFEYSSNDDVFVVNICASVKNFVAEYMIDAFGHINNDDPLNYLLNIVQKSCDFLDITYLENPGKIIFTAFWSKSDSGFNGLAFNNIQTTAQAITQLEKKIANYVPEEETLTAIEAKQNSLADRALPGGIADLLKDLPANSILGQEPEKFKETIDFAVDSFENAFPDLDISEMSQEQFEDALMKFPDQDFIEKLSDEDKKLLKERIQKSKLVEAYENEVTRMQDVIDGDENIKAELQDALSDEVAKKVSDHINAEVLNKILNKKPDEEIDMSMGNKQPMPDETIDMSMPQQPGMPTVEGDPFAIAPTQFAEGQAPALNAEGQPIAQQPGMPTVEGDPFAIAPTQFAEGQAPVLPVIEGDPFGTIPTQFKDPRTGEMIEIDPLTPGQFTDPASGELVTINPLTPGQFIDPVSGDTFEIDVFQNVEPIIPSYDEGLAETAIGGSLPFPGEPISIAGGFEGSEEKENAISAMPKEGDPVIKVGGDSDDSEDSGTLVKGGKEAADDFVTSISGMEDDKKDDFFNVISIGLADKDDKGAFKFKGSTKEEQDKNINKMVVSSLKDSALDDMDLKVKGFLQKEAPDLISKSLGNFASELGLSVTDLSDDQMAQFQSTVPSLMDGLLNDQNSIQSFHSDLANTSDIAPKTVFNDNKQVVPESSMTISGDGFENDDAGLFENKFKNKLEEKLSGLSSMEKDGDSYTISESNMSGDDIQNVIQQTMKETFEEEFKIAGATREEIAKKEQQLVSNLSKTLDMPAETVSEIVKSAADKVKEKERQLVAQKVFNESNDPTIINEKNKDGEFTPTQPAGNSIADAALMTKLKKIEEENRALKGNLNAMDIKLKSSEATNKKLDDITQMSKATDEEITKNLDNVLNIPDSEISDSEKERLTNMLKNGETLSPEDSIKLAGSMEREQHLSQISKNAETEIKKAQIELSKKDAFFKSEMDKAQKVMKAKELVLDKTKEAMKTIVTKKEKELIGLKGQVNNLSQKLENDQSTQLKANLKSMAQENETLARTTDVYKNKLEAMGKSIEANKKSDNSAQLAQEVRSLKKIKNQLENKAKEDTKAVKGFEERYNTTKLLENKLKNDLAQASGKLKVTEGQFKAFKDSQARLTKKAEQDKAVGSDKSSKDLERQKVENDKLKARVNMLMEEKKNTDMGSRVDMESAQKAAAQSSQKIVDKAKKEVDQARESSKQLQAKINKLEDKLKNGSNNAMTDGASGNDGSANEKRLEQSVKKMNTELTKTKNEMAEKKKEFIKSKAEITGLKNKLQAAAKEIDKMKKASPGKGKAKKAA